MSIEVDNVRAYLISMNRFEAADVMAEANFDYSFVDVAYPLDSEFEEICVSDLYIKFPPSAYYRLDKNKNKETIVDAINELKSNIRGEHVREIYFQMALPNLEDVESTPDFNELIADSSLYDVHRLWTKAKARGYSDADGAITASKSMLESLCRSIITANGGVYKSDDDLPKLYGMAVSYLGLSPNVQTRDEYKKLAGNCYSIVNSISCIRNRESDSHSTGCIAGPLQAKFVVNLAGSVACFLIGLMNQTKKPC